MLVRTAAKATGFVPAIVRDAFDHAIAKGQAERKARERADPAVAAAEAAAREAAQAAQVAARQAERERLRDQCSALARDPDLLKKMVEAARRLGVVGEGAAILGAYLAATSRLLLSGVINLLRRGAPAGGKNYLFTLVTELLPEGSVITISGSSPMALIYYGDNEDALKHKIILIAEAAAIAAKSNGEEHPLTVLLRTLLSEGRIDRIVAIPQPNGPPKTVHMVRNGPIALMLTSARENIDEEMLTRLMISDADETLGQTTEIVKRKLGQQTEKLEPLGEDELERWRDLQRWLEFDAPYDVEIPFQGAIWLAYLELVDASPGVVQLRVRRDISGFLGAIKTSALVHRAQRKVANNGRIIAEFADYVNAWEAFDPGMASMYGLRVREEIIAVVEAAERLGVPLFDPHAEKPPASVKLTAGAVRKAIRINSNQTANNRIKEAAECGLLKEDDAKRGEGRGSPRYFWLLQTSATLRATKPGGVFPTPEAVKKNLSGGEGGVLAGQEGQDGQEGKTDDLVRSRPAVERSSYPSYPSYPAKTPPSPPPDISFAQPEAASGRGTQPNGPPPHHRRRASTR